MEEWIFVSVFSISRSSFSSAREEDFPGIEALSFPNEITRRHLLVPPIHASQGGPFLSPCSSFLFLSFLSTSFSQIYPPENYTYTPIDTFRHVEAEVDVIRLDIGRSYLCLTTCVPIWMEHICVTLKWLGGKRKKEENVVWRPNSCLWNSRSNTIHVTIRFVV